jgi:hypothetical protein
METLTSKQLHMNQPRLIPGLFFVPLQAGSGAARYHWRSNY